MEQAYTKTTTLADVDSSVVVSLSEESEANHEWSLVINDVTHFVTIEQLLVLRNMLNSLHTEGAFVSKDRRSVPV